MISFLEAIAREEGWLVINPPSRVRRNNNPGDIEYGPFAKAHGATSTDGRFAIFPTASIGFNAMSALLCLRYQGLTVRQAITKWAPPVENDTESYIRNVCAWTCLQDTSILTSEVLGAPVPTPE